MFYLTSRVFTQLNTYSFSVLQSQILYLDNPIRISIQLHFFSLPLDRDWPIYHATLPKGDVNKRLPSTGSDLAHDRLAVVDVRVTLLQAEFIVLSTYTHVIRARTGSGMVTELIRLLPSHPKSRLDCLRFMDIGLLSACLDAVTHI